MSIDVQTDIRNTCLYRGGEFNVLMAMADCANTADGDGIYPGIDLLAANARQSIRQCQDNIRRLRADGVVKLIGPNGEDMPPDTSASGGRGRRTEYRIDLERVRELQGLHEAEEGECDFCKAREKRAYKRVQFPARKGEVSNAKGEVSDKKDAVSRPHIEPSEPSNKPSSLSASENSPSVKPKEEPSAAWSEFWTACTSWPGASDDWPESVAKAEWLALGADRPTDSEMILCARAHGVWLAEENRRRPRSAGDRIPASPHRWLKERRYSKYLEKAKANALAALDNLAKNPVTLDQPIIARILRAGISQGQIDNYFAGATYEIGPPQTFRQSIAFRASWIANNFGERLRGEFGDDLVITEKPKKVSAA